MLVATEPQTVVPAAIIEGTTTKIIDVVEAKYAHELTPEGVQRALPHLSFAQVYSALAYYHTQSGTGRANLRTSPLRRFSPRRRDERRNAGATDRST